MVKVSLARTDIPLLTAVFLIVMWTVAWILSWIYMFEIPQALNLTMPLASAVLLGVKLPINFMKGNVNGKE